MTQETPVPMVYTRLSCVMSYILLIPTFFLVFMILYRPERAVAFFDMGKGMLSFNVTIVSCILLGVMILSRVLMAVTAHRWSLTKRGWIGWQAGEVVVMGLFTALYMTLMYHGQYTYYGVAGGCIMMLTAVLIYPYLMAGWLWREMGQRELAEVDDDSLMRFRNTQKQVKLLIASSAVLYIEAKENYVIIHYKDGDKIREYTLRSSMVALEGLLQKHGIVRCQRSYYINPVHVKVLRKDKEGMISAELTTPNQKAIPVSPKYYEALTALL